ncbi:MAG: cytochrome c biogenesis protein CcsA, partial [Bacteroidota bacterium]|nr:cytochrome c biogenesis protein CcsA [Bacteroidota bacterium]
MIGEHLWLGNTGKFLLLLSFFMALFSGIVYSFGTRLTQKDEILRFNKTGKWGFFLHAISLIMSCFVLVILIFNHYFEYAYVWKYSSVQMPLRYTIACFWAGQEGSIMLWAFWQALLGLVVMVTIRNAEPRVMAVIAFAQTAILTTLLGINVGSIHLGTSPFTLLRDLPESVGNPFFSNPAYLSSIQDGVGLNPLLENIWMIIHPPVLFLGYASALIPFAFALSFLWKGNYIQGLNHGITWTIWSVFTLASGIVIGGAWAYKSLTFGGFWSWDPVENASLVPLLLMIASLHFQIVAHKQNHYFGWAFGFMIISYIMVWYASYLTRSGILGQTSVHAFGDNGMSLHLLLITCIFILAGIFLLALRYKQLPKKQGPDAVLTKDFFMLAGCMVLALSAFQITMATSIPIWNKLFGLQIALPLDPVRFYNSWQAPFTIIVLSIIAGLQYVHYHQYKSKAALKQFIAAIVIAFILTIIILLLTDYTRPIVIALFFAAILAITTSATTFLNYKAGLYTSGSVVSHIGFAVFISGIILAFSNPRTISSIGKNMNGTGYNQPQGGNVVLLRNKTVKLAQYYVVYSNRLVKGAETLYQVDFYRDAGTRDKSFTLYPTIRQSEKMGNVFNPATHNFIDKDVYAFVSHAGLLGADNETEVDEIASNREDVPHGIINANNFNLLSKQYIGLKQKLVYGSYTISLDSIWVNVKDKDYKDVDIFAGLTVGHPA